LESAAFEFLSFLSFLQSRQDHCPSLLNL